MGQIKAHSGHFLTPPPPTSLKLNLGKIGGVSKYSRNRRLQQACTQTAAGSQVRLGSPPVVPKWTSNTPPLRDDRQRLAKVTGGEAGRFAGILD